MKNRFHRIAVIAIAGLVVFASLTVQAAEKKVSHEVYLERANALIRSYQHFAAAMALQQAIRLADDKYPSIYMRLAILYYGLGMVPDAITAGEKAVALSPQTKWYKFDLAKFYLVDKQYQRSKEQLLALLQIDPGFTLAYIYLGEVYLALGEKNMAWFCLKWADKLGQDGDLLRQKLQAAGGSSTVEPEALAKGQPAFFRYIKTENRKDADTLLKQIANGKSFENLEMEFQNADSKDFRADFGLVSAPELDAGVVNQLASVKVFAPPEVVQTGSEYRVMQKILPFNRAAWTRLEANPGTAPIIAQDILPPPAPPTTVASQVKEAQPPPTTPPAIVASQAKETQSPPTTTPPATVASQAKEAQSPPTTASQPAAAVADQHKEATPATDEASVAKAIETWRDHWQNADTDLYLACYSPSFVPAKGMSLNDWRASRERSLSLPSMIQITLSDIRITMRGADQATATFRQNYTSDRLQDSVIKTLSLRREGGKWKITEEKVGKTL